jgi:hypothetical protein
VLCEVLCVISLVVPVGVISCKQNFGHQH